jgi:hypothetical protein
MADQNQRRNAARVPKASRILVARRIGIREGRQGSRIGISYRKPPFRRGWTKRSASFAALGAGGALAWAALEHRSPGARRAAVFYAAPMPMRSSRHGFQTLSLRLVGLHAQRRAGRADKGGSVMFTLAFGASQRAQRQRRRRSRPTHLAVLLGVLLPISVALGAVTILASGSPHWPASKLTDCALPAAKSVRPLRAANSGVRARPCRRKDP